MNFVKEYDLNVCPVLPVPIATGTDGHRWKARHSLDIRLNDCLKKY